MKLRSITLLLVTLLVPLLSVSGCGPKTKTPVRVFFAGSLIVPFDALEKAYEAEHPDIDIQTEGHGSIQVIRHVTDIHELIDVVVTADYSLVPMLMYASTVPDTDQPYADWYIRFATNRLALAYRPDSAYADEITSENWYDVIARPGVTVGIADPRFDACGYRALMAFQLAENATGQPTVFEDALMGRFRTAITTEQDGNRSIIHVPEIVEAKADSGIIIRGASIQLVPLLQSGDLDYIFEYESVIRQHGLELLSLPDAESLGAPDQAADYEQVEVRLDFQRFASVTPVFRGEVIGYGVTIPTNAPEPKAAQDFVAFLLGPEGQAILQEYYQPLVEPAVGYDYDNIPRALQQLCVPET